MMRKITTSLGMVALGLALALGAGTACSRQDRQEAKEKADQAAQKAADAAEAARESAAEAARKAGEAAEDAADKAGEMAGEAAGAMGMGDAVARCQKLAAEGNWADALEPCTKAHEMRPDDMAIEHAMQQAQAAAQQ